ncbi:MAG: tetratricopeptide repeat protein [bacterium]
MKQKAVNEFENKNYPEAITLLKQAVVENPNDAEIYYYLGYFTHYLCYDSVPLTGFSIEKSDEILEYLQKAIELNPKNGNAYYFIGAEYGARFSNAMRKGDMERMRVEMQAGREKGGYPDWLIEYGQNMLRSCESNAILFTGGDADANAVWYLQFAENYRRDITAMPVALLNRPWFVLVLKLGLGDNLIAAPISWSEEQILDMHPYKWKTNKLEVSVPPSELTKYDVSLPQNVMTWELKSDLSRGSQELLSPARALIANIVKTNQWQRPIYFSVACPKAKMADLDNHLQLCGLVYKLLPVETKENALALDPETIETVLLQPDHYRDFGTVKEKDMPRASVILNNYRAVLTSLAKYYIDSGKKSKVKGVLDKMEAYLPEAVFPFHAGFNQAIETLRSQLE